MIFTAKFDWPGRFEYLFSQLQQTQSCLVGRGFARRSRCTLTSALGMKAGLFLHSAGRTTSQDRDTGSPHCLGHPPGPEARSFSHTLKCPSSHFTHSIEQTLENAWPRESACPGAGEQATGEHASQPPLCTRRLPSWQLWSEGVQIS